MKKVLSRRVLALSIAVTLALSALAQLSAKFATFDKNTLITSVKVNAVADRLALHNLASEYNRVFRSFIRDFQRATEVDFSSDDACVFIYCVVDGIPNRIKYSKGGKTERIIRTYHEDRLDPGVRNLVKTHYPGYSIFGVTEVFASGKTAYLVIIENDKMWKTIRVVDGDMNLYQEFSKM